VALICTWQRVLRAATRHRIVTSIVCLAGATSGVWALASGDAVRAATGPAPLPAVFSLTSGGRFVPSGFFGISTEYDQLVTYENAGPLFDRAISLMRPQDRSRMLLRIGGKSADHTFWETSPPNYPRQVIKLGPKWMDSLADLVRQEHLRVMLDLNLAVHSPTLEASFAQAARRALPPGTLAGLEIGNEPDLYWRQPWLAKSRIASTSAATPMHWTVNYSPNDYRRDFSAYARALKAKVPGIPIGGPEIISNKTPWLDSIQDLGRLDPGFITIHRYASSSCWPKTSPWWPTIAIMLNEGSSAGLANSVRTAVEFAHSRHEALRLTEVNSISCGGNTGVANAFVTALWAPDALFSMVQAGVDSVSWHIRPGQLNAPFLFTNNGIQAMPELYGLAVFAQMITPGAELLNSTVSSALHVKGWAVRTAKGTRVLLINKGGRAANVTLRLGTGNQPGFVRRLTAPSIVAENGVTWGGQHINSQGHWEGRLVTTKVGGANGVYHLALPGYSAALVNVWR
jgi:Glycosyl hydrolase family 79 C-terminal beta domain